MTSKQLRKRWLRLVKEIEAFPRRKRVPEHVVHSWNMICLEMEGNDDFSKLDGPGSEFWMYYIEEVTETPSNTETSVTLPQWHLVNRLLSHVAENGGEATRFVRVTIGNTKKRFRLPVGQWPQRMKKVGFVFYAKILEHILERYISCRIAFFGNMTVIDREPGVGIVRSRQKSAQPVNDGSLSYVVRTNDDVQTRREVQSGALQTPKIRTGKRR